MKATLFGWVLGAAIATGWISCTVDRRSDELRCGSAADCSGGRTCEQGYCVMDSQCPSPCMSCDPTTTPHTCTIAGTNGDAITCPSNMHCDITCATTAACGAITCTNADSCTIGCTATSSCGTVTCGHADCTVNCAGTDACGDITCGANGRTGRCTIDCEGTSGCGNITCGNACACDVTGCTAGNCGSFSCPRGTGNSFCTTGGTSGAACDSTGPGCDSC